MYNMGYTSTGSPFLALNSSMLYLIWVLPIYILQHQGTPMDDIITLSRERERQRKEGRGRVEWEEREGGMGGEGREGGGAG